MNTKISVINFASGRSKINRRFVFYSSNALLLAAFLLLPACKSDEKVALPNLESKTYTSSTLELSYDGELMPGKSVSLEIDKSDASKATLRCFSKFDLSQLSGMGLSGEIPGPGVIPGSAELNIPVDLVAADGCYTFSGSSATDEVSFNYSGEIKEDKMIMNLENCRLKNQIFSGKVFVPSPIEKTGMFNYTSLPFHIVWELDPEAGIDIPLSGILKLMVTAPVIPVYNNTAYMSLAEAYYSIVKTISLNTDGNIPVMYISTVGGAAHLATTTGNMMQYVASREGIKLYVNPLSALSEALVALSKPQTDAEFVTKSTPDSGDSESLAIEIDPAVKEAVIKSLISVIAPQFSQGLPLEVTPTQDGAEIYLNTDTSVEFLSNLLQTLLQNPQIMEALTQYLQSIDIPQLPQADVAEILKLLPSYLEQTTKLEIGLSLKLK